MKPAVTSIKLRRNRTISLLGACGILLFTVIQLPRLADDWDELRKQSDHLVELESGLNDPGRESMLSGQLQEVQLELSEIQSMMIGADKLPNVQSELMEIARTSGCQLRKAVIQAGSHDSWETADAVALDDQASEFDDPTQTYTLHTEQISLSLTGTLEQVSDFLRLVSQRPWLMRTVQINFTHTPDDDGRLAVEASLAFYELKKSKSEDTEFVQWREGSRAGQIQ